MRSRRKSFRPRKGRLFLAVCLLLPGVAAAQTPAEWKTVLERLDRLESENRSLREEVGELRRLVSADGPH